MLGFVSWQCVCCASKDAQCVRVRAMKHQPASQFATILMFLLPSKRHICIHTICKECVQARQFVFPDEQMSIIGKARVQSKLFTPIPWRKQSWHLWLPSTECQEINQLIMDSGEVRLSIYMDTFLLWNICHHLPICSWSCLCSALCAAVPGDSDDIIILNVLAINPIVTLRRGCSKYD